MPEITNQSLNSYFCFHVYNYVASVEQSKKDTSPENCMHDHGTEPSKVGGESENPWIQKENLIDPGGDMEPPIEGIAITRII